MPPPPEFSYGSGNVRVIEVFKEFKPYHPAQSDGHIRITGKVEIDLESERQNQHPRAERRRLKIERRGVISCDRRHGIGEQYFFCHSRDKASRAVGELVYVFLAAYKLVVYVLISDDRTCDKLWVQRDVGPERDDILLQPRVAAVEVNGVGHDLKGVKGYADRQLEPRNGLDTRKKGEHSYIFQKEIGVFKKQQKR